MNVIVCLDDKNGMMFNGRRQSRDRLLCQRVQRMTAGGVLRMGPYSAPLFPAEETPQAVVSADFLAQAGAGEYCFVEDVPLAPWAEKVERLIVLRWNRVYPADLRLDLPLASWRRTQTEDFPGSSHEKITMEVYER